jgi:hypothetical protein
MTDAERLAKLEKACQLIREVELSYELRSPSRGAWYTWVSRNLSFLGFVGQETAELKKKIEG